MRTFWDAQIKAAREHIFVGHLKPANKLSQREQIMLRNDNGLQFSATAIRSFLSNHQIGQVFTFPYTPQENCYVEVFHLILKKAIENQILCSYDQLEERLIQLNEKYDNKRIHSSLAYLCPYKFLEALERK